MSGDRPRNIAASVYARLKNVAREEERDFNLLLIRADAWWRPSDRFELQNDLAPLAQVIEQITEFPDPALESIARGEVGNRHWVRGKGWMPAERNEK